MSRISRSRMMHRWLSGAPDNGEDWIEIPRWDWRRNDPRRVVGRVRIDGNRLVAHWSEGSQDFEMGRFVGETAEERLDGGFWLLNGEGFTVNEMTALQDHIRSRIQRDVGPPLVVPFPALRSANINLNTIRPVALERERWINEWTAIDLPDDDRINYTAKGNVTNTDNVTIEVGGNRFEFRFRDNGRWDTTRRQTISFRGQSRLTGRNLWTNLTRRNGQFGYAESIHRLGAAVFTAAIGPRGKKRHSFISAFDEAELTPFYYLAQLPDNAEVSTYREAVVALQPPIVQKAIADGLDVKRQGDIFAIPTTLTAKEIGGRMLGRSTVIERNAIKIDSRKADRDYLMIYNTGHTASEVIKSSSGATFVRGTMHHDPFLEEPGRTREHTDVALGREWHLCVRNTVPRQ